MSKLRADITWKHRINCNSFISTPISIINDIEENNYINKGKNIENLEKENDNENENEDDKDENENEDNKDENEEDDDEDEEINILESEKEFNNYLQGWAEMLDEETSKFQNEEDEMDESDISEVTNNITHPAVDSNAKWKLELLFKDLKFPF